ncbi:MAG: PIN domain-containing protein [Ignavibacteria bacterium]|jgi:predicted nucleic acid-binding protein
MVEIFVDTDVILDLFIDRKPFSLYSEQLFGLADKKYIIIYISSLSFSNIFYIIRKFESSKKAYEILRKLKTIVSVLSVDEKIIDLALTSEFNDFEDAIQYFAAKENGIEILVTRNIKDYKKAKIKVISSDEFLRTKGFIK